MKILKLEVANFRGLVTRFQDKTQPIKSLTFDSQFNVIIGINGIGKSSILDGIALLTSRILPLTTPARGGKQRFVNTDVRDGSQAISARVWFDFDGKELSYSMTDVFGQKRKITEDLDRNSTRTIAELYDSNNIDSTANAPIALFYTIDRAGYRPVRKPKEPSNNRAAAYLNALNKKGINYPFTISWLEARQTLASDKEDVKSRRLMRVIRNALERFSPAFGELEATSNPPKLYIRKGNTRLNISQLSHGERSFLAMVIDTARHLALANPETNDPLLVGKGIVLIDEIELHLHPKRQRNIVEHLKSTFPNIQFITTTHSPFVIQSLKAGQLINLDPDSFVEEYADKSIEDITEIIMGVRMPQKSERYQEMMKVAEQYFRILRSETVATPEEKQELKQKLDELSAPFSDDPAYIALLNIEREMQLGRE